MLENDKSSSVSSNKSLIASVAMHLCVVVAAFVGLPHCHHKIKSEPIIVPIQVLSTLPIKDITNIKSKDTKPLKDRPIIDKPKSAEEQKEPEKKVEKEKPKEQIPIKPKEDKPKKENLKPKDKTKPKKEEAKKITKDSKTDPKKDQKKKKKKSFDSLLKDVEEFNRPDQKEIDENPSKGNFDADKELSVELLDFMKNQVMANWNQPLGAVPVVIKVTILPDGTIENPEISKEHTKNSSDQYFQISVDEALRAIYKTAKIQGIPDGTLKGPITVGFNFHHDKG